MYVYIFMLLNYHLYFINHKDTRLKTTTKKKKKNEINISWAKGILYTSIYLNLIYENLWEMREKLIKIKFIKWCIISVGYIIIIYILVCLGGNLQNINGICFFFPLLFLLHFDLFLRVVVNI